MIKNILSVIGFILCGIIFTGCVSSMQAPKKGITNQFFRQNNGEVQNLNKYDFNKLKDGYGLCIFSYEYVGKKGNNLIGKKEQVIKGLRVWEYKFTDTEWDIKFLEKDMLVWGYPDMSALFLAKSGFKIKYRVTFHKGRVVYGGRVLVDWDTYLRDGPSMGFFYDKDIKDWWENNKNIIPVDKIDTALIVPSF